jgi:iron(II)-dependent oxidoreductase
MSATELHHRGIDRQVLADELARARARTLGLLDGLDDTQQRAQVSPLMSPFVWDLAHIGNYEELWLLRELDGRPAIDPTLDDLYNAFEHPRWQRPALPILGPTDARAYLERVRNEVLLLLDRIELTDPCPALQLDGFVYGMVLQHEHQHNETILAARQLLSEQTASPLPPGLDEERPAHQAIDVASLPEMRLVDGGPFVMGTSTHPWAYDNERTAHVVDLAPFLIDTTPVTNERYRDFIADGGYDDERLWKPAGWSWRGEEQLEAPRFWQREGTHDWSVLRFGRRLDLTRHLYEPVQHVCWYEADAYCRWAGKRLPTEPEWEKAATWDPTTGTTRPWPWGTGEPNTERANLGQRSDGPHPVGAHPAGMSPSGCLAMIGDVWEWTSSDFRSYPGFKAWPYREYSEVFWGSEYKVLRGGAWSADPVAVRSTFRNWDYPIRRQIFAGFRGARDA